VLNPKFISYEQKRHFEEGKLLPVMEAFYTLQGEGYNTGEAAFFIRIGGCDVGCRWCDIKESWNPEIHPLTSTLQVVEQAAAYPSKAVVVTGGEPLMYNLNYLCAELKKNSIKTYLETSGAYLSQIWSLTGKLTGNFNSFNKPHIIFKLNTEVKRQILYYFNFLAKALKTDRLHP
jgi:organic radical activating enzyme